MAVSVVPVARFTSRVPHSVASHLPHDYEAEVVGSGNAVYIGAKVLSVLACNLPAFLTNASQGISRKYCNSSPNNGMEHSTLAGASRKVELSPCTGMCLCSGGEIREGVSLR
jgi:hypothetical protein